MFVEIDSARIFYVAEGDGEPVTMIHGTPTSSFIWRKQIEALSSRYRVHALDLPGWGASDTPANFDYRI